MEHRVSVFSEKSYWLKCPISPFMLSYYFPLLLYMMKMLENESRWKDRTRAAGERISQTKGKDTIQSSSKCATNGNILFIKKHLRTTQYITVFVEYPIFHVNMIYGFAFSVETGNVVCDLVAIRKLQSNEEFIVRVWNVYQGKINHTNMAQIIFYEFQLSLVNL